MRTRKEEERLQKKKLIVRCARKCFFLYGLKGATMEGIARECRLAKGTLYLYFSGKEEIYISLVEEAIMLLNRSIDQAIEEASGDVERQIMDIADRYYRFSRTNREYFKILMMIDYDMLSSRIHPDRLMRIQVLQQEANNRIEGVLRDGIRQGIFPEETDVTLALRSSWAMLLGGIFLVEKSRQKMPMLHDIDHETFTGDLMRIMLSCLKSGFITRSTNPEVTP
jgi:AcrR family transcriptional regulator